jgi:hypothetical protein
MIPTVTNFIAAHSSFSRKLFDLHGNVPQLGSRLGRGEVLVYFLFDDVTLGGSSSNVDVFKNGEPYLEIKCATKLEDRWANFFMGMDEVPASLKFFYKLLKLFEKNDRAGKLALPTSFAHISKSKLDALKKVSQLAYKGAEEEYLDDLMASPIGQKLFLFFDSETSLPFFCGNLTRDQLRIERISGGLTRLSFCP